MKAWLLSPIKPTNLQLQACGKVFQAWLARITNKHSLRTASGRRTGISQETCDGFRGQSEWLEGKGV